MATSSSSVAPRARRWRVGCVVTAALASCLCGGALDLVGVVSLLPHRPRHLESGIALTYACDAPVARGDADGIDKRLSHLGLNAIADMVDPTHVRVRIDGDASDVERVRALMTPHRLEIRPVDEGATRALVGTPLPSGVTVDAAGLPTASDEAALSMLAAADGTTLVTGCPHPPECHAWIVGPSELGREHVSDARVGDGPSLFVELVLTPDGARRFEALTRRVAGQRVALLLDGHVRMAPVVQEPITGGRVSLAMDARTTRDEAEALAISLPTQHTECAAWELESETTF